MPKLLEMGFIIAKSGITQINPCSDRNAAQLNSSHGHPFNQQWFMPVLISAVKGLPSILSILPIQCGVIYYNPIFVEGCIFEQKVPMFVYVPLAG